MLSVSDKLSAKVLDVQCLSNYCHKCSIMRAKTSPDDFVAWQKNHQMECSKNHHGSAGTIELEGILTIFNRYKSGHNLMYTGYLGDGDVKSYRKVSTQQPPIYGKRNAIKKLECCGHVQKSMGKRLMDKVAAC